MRAMVRSMSACGVMDACWSCCMVGLSPFLLAGMPFMTLTMLLHVSSVNFFDAPMNHTRGGCIEFGGGLHAHHGSQAEVGQVHERAGDAAVAQRMVGLGVVDEGHDAWPVEVGFDRPRRPLAFAVVDFVDLAGQPCGERGDAPGSVVLVGDGQGRAEAAASAVPDARAPVGRAGQHEDAAGFVGVFVHGDEAASVDVGAGDRLGDVGVPCVVVHEFVHLRLQRVGRVEALEHVEVGERSDCFVGPSDHRFGEGAHFFGDAVGDAVVSVSGLVVFGSQHVACVVVAPCCEEFLDGGHVVVFDAFDAGDVGGLDGEVGVLCGWVGDGEAVVVGGGH